MLVNVFFSQTKWTINAKFDVPIAQICKSCKSFICACDNKKFFTSSIFIACGTPFKESRKDCINKFQLLNAIIAVIPKLIIGSSKV